MSELYRVVQCKFWSDSKVQEEMSPEDRYIFLYLLTNEQTNLCGCYEIPYKRIAFDTGYEIKSCKSILGRLIDLGLIDYDNETNEVLIINWGKNNWTSSEKFLKGVKKAIKEIKSKKFSAFLTAEVESDTLCIPYIKGMDTLSIPYAYPMHIENRDIEDSTRDIEIECREANTDTEDQRLIEDTKPVKHRYGEYSNVLLNDNELEKLKERFPDSYNEKIKQLDEGIELKGYKYKSHYLAILKWAENDKVEKKKSTTYSKQVDNIPKEINYGSTTEFNF